MKQEGSYVIYSPKAEIPNIVYHTWHEAFMVADKKAKEENLAMYILKIDTIIEPKTEIKTELNTDVSHINKLI